ncbi:hypothetical protein PR048_002189 [Dryococelus australis]|uniref:Peptidase M14 domain-containing protein n=1 Tax=Dryococelus australis TaxID=614101 RepID=A0ABQ9IM05_9NEOP|nr:hypothetical protein PR048_002189 [Dryococelus australis]
MVPCPNSSSRENVSSYRPFSRADEHFDHRGKLDRRIDTGDNQLAMMQVAALWSLRSKAGRCIRSSFSLYDERAVPIHQGQRSKNTGSESKATDIQHCRQDGRRLTGMAEHEELRGPIPDPDNLFLTISNPPLLKCNGIIAETTLEENAICNPRFSLQRSRRQQKLQLLLERARVQGRGKREIFEKTRRPAASSGTIPTYENPDDPAGIRTRFPLVEASSPTTTTLWLPILRLQTYFLLSPWGRGGVVVRLLASHLGEPGSILGGATPGPSHAGIVPDDAAGWRGFSVSPALTFRRCTILASLNPDRFSRPRCQEPPKSLHAILNPSEAGVHYHVLLFEGYASIVRATMVGSSSDPCSEIYAGPKPFSEYETTYLANYLWRNKAKIKMYLALHSYGGIAAKQIVFCAYHVPTLGRKTEDRKLVLAIREEKMTNGYTQVRRDSIEACRGHIGKYLIKWVLGTRVSVPATTSANLQGVSRATVSGIVAAYGVQGETSSAKHSSGRKQKSTDRDRRAFKRNVISNKKTTATKWCKDHKTRTTDQWKHAMWSDESTFRSSLHVWGASEETYNCLLPTVKHVGGSAIVWEAIPCFQRALPPQRRESALSREAFPRFGFPIGVGEESRPISTKGPLQINATLARSKTQTWHVHTPPPPFYRRGSETVALRKQSVRSGRGSIHTPSDSPEHNRSRLLLTARSINETRVNLKDRSPERISYGANRSCRAPTYFKWYLWIINDRPPRPGGKSGEQRQSLPLTQEPIARLSHPELKPVNRGEYDKPRVAYFLGTKLHREAAKRHPLVSRFTGESSPHSELESIIHHSGPTDRQAWRAPSQS